MRTTRLLCILAAASACEFDPNHVNGYCDGDCIDAAGNVGSCTANADDSGCVCKDRPTPPPGPKCIQNGDACMPDGHKSCCSGNCDASGVVPMCSGDAAEDALKIAQAGQGLFMSVPAATSISASALAQPACTDAADTAIWTKTGKADYTADLTKCGKSCMGKAACATACIEKTDGYTGGCSTCFGSLIGCTASKCWSKCILGESAACTACTKASCVPAFSTCSGLADPDADAALASAAPALAASASKSSIPIESMASALAFAQSDDIECQAINCEANGDKDCPAGSWCRGEGWDAMCWCPAECGVECNGDLSLGVGIDDAPAATAMPDCSKTGCPAKCSCAEDNCAADLTACLGDSSCVAGQTCASACACGDSSCLIKCGFMHPSAKAATLLACTEKNCPAAPVEVAVA